MSGATSRVRRRRQSRAYEGSAVAAPSLPRHTRGTSSAIVAPPCGWDLAQHLPGVFPGGQLQNLLIAERLPIDLLPVNVEVVGHRSAPAQACAIAITWLGSSPAARRRIWSSVSRSQSIWNFDGAARPRMLTRWSIHFWITWRYT